MAFHQTFECPKGGGNFEDVKLYFKDFKPVQRGRLVKENESEYRLCDGSKVMAVQLMLSKFSYWAWTIKTLITNQGRLILKSNAWKRLRIKKRVVVCACLCISVNSNST